MGAAVSLGPGMLSRVAGNLFWIGRLMDRAENIARLADAARRIEALPGETLQHSEWTSALIAAGLRDDDKVEVSGVTREKAVHLLFFAGDNPSSVANCIMQSRENARAVRTDLTQEVWETLNQGWRAYRELEAWENDPSALAKLIDWIKGFSAQFRGAVNGTMLRNDGFHFIRLGQAVERIDSTARILDVKYHVLLPDVGNVGSANDRTQWQALLHASSAQRAYAFVTKADLSGRGVAAFLVLNEQFPRSIRFNTRFLRETMRRLEAYYDRPAGCHQMVVDFANRLEHLNIGDIIASGLHEFLTETVSENYAVANALGVHYGFAPAEAETQVAGDSSGQ